MTADAAGRSGASDAHRPTSIVGLGLRLLTVAGLVVDAVIHIHLAPGYQFAAPGGIGQGNLFRIEAALAIVAALGVLLRPARATYAAAFLVAAGGLAAVLLYRYVDVPAVGPIPSMYEPVWFGEKSLSAVAEGVSALAALISLLSARADRARR